MSLRVIGSACDETGLLNGPDRCAIDDYVIDSVDYA